MQIMMKDTDLIVSKTDIKGRITYGNEVFIKMSGFQEKELLNSPHNILRHEDMPSVVFKLFWETLENKGSINAYVKNKCKNGDYYWVYATASPSIDINGNVIGYYSVRCKPNPKALNTIELIYADLLKIEQKAGIYESEQFLKIF